MTASSSFANELIALYQPLSAWQDKLFISDLVNRMADFEQSFPGTAKASHTQTSSYFDYICELKSFVKEYAQNVGIDPDATITVEDEKINLYDFSCLNYAGFEALVVQTNQQLLIDVPDLAAVIPSWVAAMGPGSITRMAISKILAILGITEFYAAFLEVVEQGWGNILKAIGEAIVRKDWKALRALLKKLLDIIMSREFFERLAARIGRKAAAKLIGKILAKFLPIVGWLFLIGSIIWAFAEEFI